MEKPREINRKLMRSNLKLQNIKNKIEQAKKINSIIQRTKLSLEFEQIDIEHKLRDLKKVNFDEIVKEEEHYLIGQNYNLSEELITDPNPFKSLNEICPGETYSNNKLKEEDDDLE